MARWDTIRSVIAVAAFKGWKVLKLDVKRASLHGEISEAVFVEQPARYVKKGAEKKVYRLRKALYGLKQVPRAWYNKIGSYFIKEGFTKSPSEYTVYMKNDNAGYLLIVSLYLDDLIFTGHSHHMFTEFK